MCVWGGGGEHILLWLVLKQSIKRSKTRTLSTRIYLYLKAERLVWTSSTNVNDTTIHDSPLSYTRQCGHIELF